MLDQDTLRRYLAAGGRPEDIGLTPDQLTGNLTEPAPTGNALRQMIDQAQGNIVVGPNDYNSAGESVPRVNDMQGTVYAPPGGKTNIGITDDPALAAQNGWTLIGNKGQGGQGGQVPQGQAAQGPQGGPMRVIGTGNGTTVEMSPEVAPAKVNIDYSRSPLDVNGTRVYYTKDNPGVGYAIDGSGRPTTKVYLGYDDAGTQARNKALLDQQHTRQEIAQSQASVEHTQEATRASRVNNPDFGTPGGVGGPTGEALLQNLDAGTAATIKSMLDGRMQPPGQMALRNPRVLQLINLANQVDPTFDATTWTERYKTAADFSTAGKSGQVVQAINQALHHADNLSQNIDALNNSNFAPGIVNPIVNTFEQKIMGDSRQGNFMTTANALSEELKKIYAGGGGSLAELQNWQKSFDPNAGQQQQRDYLKTGMQLLQGAIDSRKMAFERGMGPKANFGNLIDPSAQSALERLTGASSAGPMTQEQVSQIRSDARRAIQQGAPLEAVRARLRQQGLPDTGF